MKTESNNKEINALGRKLFGYSKNLKKHWKDAEKEAEFLEKAFKMLMKSSDKSSPLSEADLANLEATLDLARYDNLIELRDTIGAIQIGWRDAWNAVRKELKSVESSLENTADVSSKEKKEFIEMEGITLDGKPAKISGAKLPFASVSQINGPLSVEFSWEAVKHVVENNDGEFKS